VIHNALILLLYNLKRREGRNLKIEKENCNFKIKIKGAT